MTIAQDIIKYYDITWFYVEVRLTLKQTFTEIVITRVKSKQNLFLLHLSWANIITLDFNQS